MKSLALFYTVNIESTDLSALIRHFCELFLLFNGPGSKTSMHMFDEEGRHSMLIAENRDTTE